MRTKIVYSQLKLGEAQVVRDFCLKVIKEVYKLDYNPNWHADLDDLTNPEGMYTTNNRGAFFVARRRGKIIGTIGVKTLNYKPEFVRKFKFRNYKDGRNVASIWRAYVDKDYRNQGIGIKLVTLAEEFISEQKLPTTYLHTSWNNPSAIVFWQKRGYYTILDEKDQNKTVHMEKTLIV